MLLHQDAKLQSTYTTSDISVTVTNTKTEMIGHRFTKQKRNDSNGQN